jgi:hypothetical protein
MPLFIKREEEKMRFHSFIFNWKGQYENAKSKETHLKSLGVKVTVINSDDTSVSLEPNWVHVGETSYFTAQFLKAIELFDGDIFFHVQADASYENWSQLFEDALKYYTKYNWGIYAPNVNYTWYGPELTDIPQVVFQGNENLRLVACPDCTCWFIHKDIINQFRDRKIDMSPYHMGWGWDIVLPGISYLKQRLVLRDYAHTIHHPRGTGYNTEQAEKEMFELFRSLPDDLRRVFSYIKGDRLGLINVLIGEKNV